MTNPFEISREGKELFEEVEEMFFMIEERTDIYIETPEFAHAFWKMPDKIMSYLKKYKGEDLPESLWKLGDALAHAHTKLELIGKEIKDRYDEEARKKPWLVR